MKKYQKPELEIFNLIVKNGFAATAIEYKSATLGEGGVPVSNYEISSFNDESGTE